MGQGLGGFPASDEIFSKISWKSASIIHRGNPPVNLGAENGAKKKSKKNSRKTIFKQFESKVHRKIRQKTDLKVQILHFIMMYINAPHDFFVELLN